MPHTSHKGKKVNQHKRQQILDEDGWTHVTSTGHPRTTMLQPTTNESDNALDVNGRQAFTSLSLAVPMSPAKGSTMESMRATYSRFETRWKETELCKSLVRALENNVLLDGPLISTCVVLGTGSFCGDAVHWIDRHDSAYFQLAAFKTMIHTLERVQGRPIPAYAQEPHYNELDVALLDSLSINKIEHPRGFDLLDEHSCVYSPAAEREVELQVLARNPRIWLHRALEDAEGDVKEGSTSQRAREAFKKTHTHTQMPALEIKNFPFHGSVLWWRKHDDLEEG